MSGTVIPPDVAAAPAAIHASSAAPLVLEARPVPCLVPAGHLRDNAALLRHAEALRLAGHLEDDPEAEQ